MGESKLIGSPEKSIEDMIEKFKDFLALVRTLRSETLSEECTRLRVLEYLLECYRKGRTVIAGSDLLSELEGFGTYFSEAEIIDMMESTKMVVPVGDRRYTLRGKFSLSDLFSDGPSDECGLQAYSDLLDRSTSTWKSENVGFSRVVDIFMASLEWLLRAIELTSGEGMIGLPTFLWTKPDGQLSPLGLNPSSISTFDAVNLLLEPTLYGYALPRSDERQERLLGRLWEWGKTFIVTDEGWNRGGTYPGEDYPSAEYPVVDSTALSLFSMSLLYRFASEISSASWGGEIKKYVGMSTQFLTRMQRDDGGWGLFRYGPDRDHAKGLDFPVHDFSCHYSLVGLSHAQMIGVLDEDARKKTREAVDRCVSYLLAKAVEGDHGICWAADFTGPAEGIESILTTTRVLQGLMTVCFAWRERIPAFVEKLHKGRDFLLSQWNPSTQNIGRSRVRAPKRDGPSEIFTWWETPVDPLVVSYLLESSKEFGFKLELDDWRKIEKAISGFVSSEANGYWTNPDPDPTKRWAFISQTYLHRRALMLYLWHVNPSLPVTNK